MSKDKYETFIKNVIMRLEKLDYKYDSEKDDLILKYITDKVEQEIMNRINQSEVPDELRFVLVERVCGEFLYSLRGSNILSDTQINAIVSSISEGDTSVSYDVSSSPEAKFDLLITCLRSYGNDEILRFRRLVW